MRYYTIDIFNPGFKEGDKPFRTYSSQNQLGAFNPSALNVELDIPVQTYATPSGTAFVRVWGIPIIDIFQGNELTGKTVRVYGGMQKGLPLANPQQAGLLIEGTIFQAFGNWISTNQTLDMIIYPTTGNPAAPLNLVLPWRKGTLLADAIRNTLSVAFPGYTANINISNNLVLPHDEPGYFQSLTEFARYVKTTSQAIVGGTYQGVDITLKQKAFNVSDGTTLSTPKMIAFTDLIGQPTWIDPGTIQVTCVMRADLETMDYIKLPPGPVYTTAQALSQFRQGSIFQGTFQINTMRHLGNYRQASASSWVSVFNVNTFSAKAAA